MASRVDPSNDDSHNQTQRLEQTLSDLEQQRSRLVTLLLAQQIGVNKLGQSVTKDHISLKDTTELDDTSDSRDEALKIAKRTLQQHIDALSRYNDIKDVATGMIGMIAEARQQRIIDVMSAFEADVDD